MPNNVATVQVRVKRAVIKLHGSTSYWYNRRELWGIMSFFRNTSSVWKPGRKLRRGGTLGFLACAALGVSAFLFASPVLGKPTQSVRLLQANRSRMASDGCWLKDGSLLLASEWMLSHSLRRVSVRRCKWISSRWRCGLRRYLRLRRATNGQSDPTLVCPDVSNRTAKPGPPAAHAAHALLYVREGDLRKGRAAVAAFRVKLPPSGGRRSLWVRLRVNRLKGFSLPAGIRSARDMRPFARRGLLGGIWLSVTVRRTDGGRECWLLRSPTGIRFTAHSGKPVTRGLGCAAVRVKKDLWVLAYHVKGGVKQPVRACYRWSVDGRTWSTPRRLMGGGAVSSNPVALRMPDGSVRFYLEVRRPRGRTIAEVAFSNAAPFPRERDLLAPTAQRRLRPVALRNFGPRPGALVIYAQELSKLRFELRTLAVP